VNFGEKLPKDLNWVRIQDKSYDWCQSFLLEILEWDGSKVSDINGTYSSIIKENVDKVQEVCSVCGYKSYTSLDERDKEPNKKPIYKIQFSKGNYFGVAKLEKEEVYYEGNVYCVEVPSHKLIVRRGGRTVVCGNSARRGSFAAYLPVEHPDIEEFLMIRSEGHSIQNMSIGVTVSDDWMNKMIEGDKDKRAIWAKIIKKRFETGYPYIFFTDTVNNNAPQVYKDKGYKINSSNLCVTGDTLIEILVNKEEKILIKIKDLEFYLKKYNKVQVKSFDTEKGNTVFSNISAFAQTGESTELIEIEDEEGNILRCTPDHPVYTTNRGYVLAGELLETDILVNSK
jgi:intein/homing endonuclease